jgi:hypothetical protein
MIGRYFLRTNGSKGRKVGRKEGWKEGTETSFKKTSTHQMCSGILLSFCIFDVIVRRQITYCILHKVRRIGNKQYVYFFELRCFCVILVQDNTEKVQYTNTSVTLRPSRSPACYTLRARSNTTQITTLALVHTWWNFVYQISDIWTQYFKFRSCHLYKPIVCKYYIQNYVIVLYRTIIMKSRVHLILEDKDIEILMNY